jgi:hypothetical protein
LFESYSSVSLSFRSQHIHFQKPVFKWLSSDILRFSLWLLNVVDVNLIFILNDVVGSGSICVALPKCPPLLLVIRHYRCISLLLFKVPNINMVHVNTLQVDITTEEVKKDDTADEAGNYQK